MSEVLDLTIELIRRPSVTPEDAGCQELLIQHLAPLGFSVERLRFGEVENFWARRGKDRPVFAFAGHTDVVPPGAQGQWTSSPFLPDIRGGHLFGRGAADMKGSLAAMVVACRRFVRGYPRHRGSIAFLITSDEEGPGVDGTARVVGTLSQRNETIDYCLIGEPSSHKKLGDVIKNGRRGSLHGWLRVHGTPGHVAYPHLANNAVHAFAPALTKLCAETWDRGDELFSPTGFQVTSMRVIHEAENMIPGDLEVRFNFRYSPAVTREILQTRVTEILDLHALEYSLEWRETGKPFITENGELIEATRQAIREVAGITTQLSTVGGTSDGRFIAPTGAEVVELGPVNATIHKIDECVDIDELDKLVSIYERVLEIFLVEGKEKSGARGRI